MKELSLNVLDVAKNSVKAGAQNVVISIIETEETLTLTISDDGCGMTPEFLANVTDPFCTTRTTRAVGLGIPLLKLQAEQTGGNMSIESKHHEMFPNDHGTTTRAMFYKNHIDMTPLGDICSSVVTLIQGNPDIDFLFTHTSPDFEVKLDTKELKAVLGDDVPLDNAEVLLWITEYLKGQYNGS